MGAVNKATTPGKVGSLVRHPKVPRSLALSEDQRAAVEHRGSPLILRGTPGTGKTSTLIANALSRIEEGQDPNSILMITYGRERASELRDAVALHTTVAMSEPIARTFHSLAFSILKMKMNIDDPEPILMSGPEQDSYISQLLEGDFADFVESGFTYWTPDLVDPKSPAIATRGFARELRDLILRAAERNLSPDDLHMMGEAHREKYWLSCAQFWKRYQGSLVMQEISAGDSKRRIDPSQIVIEAFHHVNQNADLARQLRSRFSTILVDEFQESDPAQRMLLRELAGQDILICVDKESAVGRFRGADPDQLGDELQHYLESGSEIILNKCFRSSPRIVSLGAHVASQFPSNSRKFAHGDALQGASEEPSPIAARLRSQSEEAQFIAYQFRRAHLLDGTPWSEMAVILRAPGALASSLRRAFVQSGIPVASEVDVLSGNPAIAPFLLLAEVALGRKFLTPAVCESLLLSEFGGADTLSLRRIKKGLLTSREEGDLRTGAQMLAEAIETGEIDKEKAPSVVRVHDLLAGARKTLRRNGVQAEDLLWEIWNNALTSNGEKLSESWRRQALRGGSRGASADRDLDAMIQLFESARRYADRFPYSGAESFIRQISEERIHGDVITAKGQRGDVVEILTVHSAKGREWEFVAVAGLQDGAWPNLRQRGSLLGSERLVERMRHGSAPLQELDALAASGLIEDERRLIYVATTRAKRHLLFTCIQKDDAEPSIYFDEIAEYLGSQAQQSFTEVPRPLTASALVATLRGAIQGDEKESAAGLLRRLADEGITIADPNSWYGVLPVSSNSAVVSPGQQVSVSPSGGESFAECGLKWFLERSGGTDGNSTAQVLGSAIHAFAALMESDDSLTEEDLVEKLRNAWNLIDPNTGWVRATQLTKALEMIRKFVAYHTKSRNTVVGVEAKFVIDVGRARIRGSVDRLELTTDGNLYVVDFKTGSVIPSKADALTNMQMQAYQLAILEGAFTQVHSSHISAGAELVYLGSKTKEASSRTQPPIDKDEVKTQFEEIADGMASNAFLATINGNCNRCAVRSSCPIQSDGRAVME